MKKLFENWRKYTNEQAMAPGSFPVDGAGQSGIPIPDTSSDNISKADNSGRVKKSNDKDKEIADKTRNPIGTLLDQYAFSKAVLETARAWLSVAEDYGSGASMPFYRKEFDKDGAIAALYRAAIGDMEDEIKDILKALNDNKNTPNIKSKLADIDSKIKNITEDMLDPYPKWQDLLTKYASGSNLETVGKFAIKARDNFTNLEAKILDADSFGAKYDKFLNFGFYTWVRKEGNDSVLLHANAMKKIIAQYKLAFPNGFEDRIKLTGLAGEFFRKLRKNNPTADENVLLQRANKLAAQKLRSGSADSIATPGQRMRAPEDR